MKIILIPTQGFCNRLRAIASTYVLSKFLNTDFYVIWNPEECCNIDCGEIFMTKFNSINLEEIKNKNYFYNPNIHTNIILNNNDIYKLDYLIIQGGHEFKHPNMSLYDFIKEKNIFYKSLKFTKSVRNIVNEFLMLNGTKIGIHYRDYIKKYDEADGRKFNEESPIEIFIEKMKNILKNNPKASFFISTNSDESLNKFKSIFPNIIHINNQSNERNDKNSIIQAVANVILLSKCKFIIGTHMSSFSDEACFFNMIPKLCISKSKSDNVYHSYGFSEIFGEKMLLPSFDILKLCN